MELYAQYSILCFLIISFKKFYNTKKYPAYYVICHFMEWSTTQYHVVVDH